MSDHEKSIQERSELQDHSKGDLMKFALTNFSDELLSILLSDEACQHYSINVDTMSLLSSNVAFAHILFECSEKALKILDSAFQEAALKILQDHNIKNSSKIIHARLTALPDLPEIYRTHFPHCSDAGQFMCITGTVIRASSSKVIEYKKLWRCSKCKYRFTIEAAVEKGYVFEKPLVCPNPDWCNGKNFTLLSTDIDPAHCKDYREVKLQQQFNSQIAGSIPRSMWVILEDDLVESCHPGNVVSICGILIQRWKPLNRGNFMNIDLVLLAHNVEVKNKSTHDNVSESMLQELQDFWIEHKNDPLKGRDFILSCICPQVFGLYIVKLAVSLVLAGGVEKKDTNSRIRGDSHLLLVGDPGTGKSEFLKFASRISPRSVLTSGIGTTNAGLTVSAVKEGGKWQLEAGALVLADGGVCCIDEFNSIKTQDKTCIHEAMEQQTISVAKAGLVCSLSTKCSIIAATNPKGKYDDNLSLSENIALASPLLSRFDIILVLLDGYDANWDRMVSSYILEGRGLSAVSLKDTFWPLSKIRSYFSLIRHIKPTMTSACEKILQAYYQRQRSLENRNYARTTPRLLQSLIRLAEGHARLMFRAEVLIIDAVIAIILMESSMSGSPILDGLAVLHTSFPSDPRSEYNDKAEVILKLLGLQNLLEESHKYIYSYEESTMNQLLSEVSLLYKTGKNSDLSVTSGMNESNKRPISELSGLSPVPQMQRNEDLVEAEMDSNFMEIIDMVNPVILKDLDKSIRSPPRKGEVLMENRLNTGALINNEISTLSDLKETFPSVLLDQVNNSSSKRKHDSDNDTSDFFEDCHRLPLRKAGLNFDNSDSNTSLIETNGPHLKQKRLSLEKFTFQKSNKPKKSATGSNGALNADTETYSTYFSNIPALQNKKPTNTLDMGDRVTLIDPALNGEKATCDNSATEKNIRDVAAHCETESVTSDPLCSKTALDSQGYSSAKCDSNSAENSSVSALQTNKPAIDEKLQKFLFKSRPSKRNNEDNTKTIDVSSTLSTHSTVSTNSEIIEKKKDQSSQALFKKIFSSSVKETFDFNFDDPF